MIEVPSKPVIILGAGGHAKVITEALIQSGRKVLGFVTPDISAGTLFFKSTVLGDDDIINKYQPSDIELANGIGALPDFHLRWELAAKMRNQGYGFTTIIHPSATVAEDAKFEEGVQVMAGVVIQPGTTIGRDTIINTGAKIDHDCSISENCHIAPGVVCSGGIKIGENSHLGTGSVVIHNVLIGSRCVVAAGSTVYSDIPSGMRFYTK